MSGARTLLYALDTDAYALLERNEFLELPGGKIKPTETALEAAIRKLEEETSIILHPNDMNLAGIVNITYGSKGSFPQVVFAAAKKEQPASPAVLWIPRNGLLEAPLQPEMKHFLAKRESALHNFYEEQRGKYS
jgi:8-oxo-dGTP pyrophosphatase MutT (NUDIX family)